MTAVAQAFDMAIRHYQSGKLHQAEQICRQVLRSEPWHVNALRLLGLIALQAQDNDLARDCLSKAVQVAPDDADSHNNLAIALREQGKLKEAIASLRECIRLAPEFAEGHNNLGTVLRNQGRLPEAEESVRQALRLKPNYADAYYNLGMSLFGQRRLDEARECYEQALCLKPDFTSAQIAIVKLLHAKNEFAKALALCRDIVLREPGNAEAHNSLGYILYEQGSLAEAVASYQEALRLQPANLRFQQAQDNLRIALIAQGQLAEAQENACLALEIDPKHARAHYDQAHVWLLQGEFAQGWPEYEWRWRLPILPPRTFPQPLWRGEPLNGRTILLHAEQGLGDTIQFVRFVPQVKACGGSVLLECQPALFGLLKEFP